MIIIANTTNAINTLIILGKVPKSVIIALGNEQYSIKPEAVGYFDHDHTVTYCVSIENGDDIQKYYFTVK